MSLESAKEYLKKFSLENNIILFNVSSATVKDAALALNTKEERIAKTISLLTNDGPIVIVTTGNKKISNRKYKDVFKEKARMLQGEEVERYTGHKIGGVCPFGLKEGVRIFLDLSLKDFPTVFPAAGSDNSAIEMSAAKLEEVTAALWVDVTE